MRFGLLSASRCLTSWKGMIMWLPLWSATHCQPEGGYKGRMQTASQNIPLKQKQLILSGDDCSGRKHFRVGSNSSARTSKDNVALRPWLRPLIDMGLVETNDGKTKSVEYRLCLNCFGTAISRGRQHLGALSPHRLRRELIL